MATIACMTFNPFQENTYVIYDSTNECIIIDPGCSDAIEQVELAGFIQSNHLKPVMLVNTHCHVDHVFGNRFVFDSWGLSPICHPLEVQVLDKAVEYGRMFGVIVIESPKPQKFIEEGDEVRFGNTVLKVLFTPGHSPGSVSLYCEESHFVVAGDVLFHESIGRTDLPGGDFPTLENSIKTKLYTLPADVKVLSGHGPDTTIGHEMRYNPFVKG
jgi:hydroxyacylglutathione hydrolase